MLTVLLLCPCLANLPNNCLEVLSSIHRLCKVGVYFTRFFASILIVPLKKFLKKFPALFFSENSQLFFSKKKKKNLKKFPALFFDLPSSNEFPWVFESWCFWFLFLFSNFVFPLFSLDFVIFCFFR